MSILALKPTLSPARWFVFLFFLHVAISMVLFMLLLPSILPFDSADLLDNTAGYDSQMVKMLFAEYGEAGRGAYQSYLIFLDIPYALLTALAVISALRLLCDLFPRVKTGKWIYIFPIILIALDFTENGLMLMLLHFFPNLNESLVNMAGIVTTLKLALVNVAFLLFLLVWVSLVWKCLAVHGGKQGRKDKMGRCFEKESSHVKHPGS